MVEVPLVLTLRMKAGEYSLDLGSNPGDWFKCEVQADHAAVLMDIDA